MNNKKASLLLICILSFCFFSCAKKSNENKKNVYQTIIDIYYREILDLKRSEDYHNYSINKKDDIAITSYCGHEGNVYAVTLTPVIYPEWFYMSHIEIDLNSDNEEEKYISVNSYSGYNYPLVFTSNNVYALDDALQEKLITIHFIKNIDDFKNEHSINELKEKYYE